MTKITVVNETNWYESFSGFRNDISGMYYILKILWVEFFNLDQNRNR